MLYCTGSRRISVPHAKFLIHEPYWTFEQSSLNEGEVDEILKRLTAYKQNVAKVIAINTGKTTLEVLNIMHQRTTFTPDEAVTWGLVHENQFRIIQRTFRSHFNHQGLIYHNFKNL